MFGQPVNSVGGGFFTANAGIYGYGEGNISELNQGKVTITLEVLVEVEGKGGYKQYFMTPVAIPVNLFVEGSVKGSVGFQGELKFDNWKVTGVDFSGGGIDIKVEVTAGGGVGVGLELNASVTGSLNYTWKPLRAYEKLWLEASGKITAVAWVFEKDLWKSKNYKYTIYEEGNDKGISSDNYSGGNGTSEFHALGRAYLDYSTGYNDVITDMNVDKGSNYTTKATVIKQAIYPAANPQMVRTNDGIYLFWLEDIIAREANNRTALVYCCGKAFCRVR